MKEFTHVNALYDITENYISIPKIYKHNIQICKHSVIHTWTCDVLFYTASNKKLGGAWEQG